MTPHQKQLLIHSITIFREHGPIGRKYKVENVRQQLKDQPDHKNALPARVFLRIYKYL